ncbi:uncharacterized protein JCM6883_007290, partial [Sporobolomyces salmoneus]|uniref:uncharacterized protein n=1 Tax=Sporobolomyces salmoneus TaxID=183962 RepID=UPI0031748095
MQALLLSPATTFLSSPDSSNSLSPSTPALPSLDFLTQIDDEATLEQQEEEEEQEESGYSRTGGVDTPTHAPPKILRRQTTTNQSSTATREEGPSGLVNRRSSIPPVPLTTPRIPSNLRYAFNANQDQSTTSITDSFTSPTRSQTYSLHSETEPELVGKLEVSNALIQFDQSLQQTCLPPPRSDALSPNTSSTSSVMIGTFVVNSTKVNGAGLQGGGGAENDQLAAAIRAFKGPPQSAGLFGVSTEEEESVEAAGSEGKTGGAKAAGKGNAVPLPKSTISAPSLDSFSFSPPLASSIPTSTSTPTYHTPASSASSHITTPSCLYDQSHSSELTPLAIPPLIPTQTPRPYSSNLVNTPMAEARTPSLARQGLVGEAVTRGLEERKAEKKFLKRSTTAIADNTGVGRVGEEEREVINPIASTSNTTVRPPLPLPASQTAFSIADLIDSLPSQIPQSHSDLHSVVQSSRVGGDYSTTQEFESAYSRTQSRFEPSRSQVAYAEQQQPADWSSTEEDEEDEDDRTTQEGEDETDQYEAGRGGGGGEGCVPPSTMTLQELKDNGFVSSSEEDQEEDSDLEDEEDDNRFAGVNSVRNVSAGSGRHLGYSGSSASSSSSEDEEEEEHEATHEYRHRRRGPLQSSSNAPSSHHSSFVAGASAPPAPLPNPPTLTFDHLTPPPSHNDNNDTSYRSPSPNQPHLAPLASPL